MTGSSGKKQTKAIIEINSKIQLIVSPGKDKNHVRDYTESNCNFLTSHWSSIHQSEAFYCSIAGQKYLTCFSMLALQVTC